MLFFFRLGGQNEKKDIIEEVVKPKKATPSLSLLS